MDEKALTAIYLSYGLTLLCALFTSSIVGGESGICKGTNSNLNEGLSFEHMLTKRKLCLVFIGGNHA